MIRQLSLHSDNAAQHFKSSKSLHWLSKQLADLGFASGLWDFGPPGHGKVIQTTRPSIHPLTISLLI